MTRMLGSAPAASKVTLELADDVLVEGVVDLGAVHRDAGDGACGFFSHWRSLDGVALERIDLSTDLESG